MSWEEDEYILWTPEEKAEINRRQAEYEAQKAEEIALGTARNVRQAGMTNRQKLLNNITHRNHPLPGLRGKPLGALSSRVVNTANRARKAQLSSLQHLNRVATQRAREAAEEVNTWAGSKLTRGLSQGYARKMMRNRAARPPGTLGPNNTGGELYKLWASKTANRWPKTRKARKSRKSRKSRRN